MHRIHVGLSPFRVLLVCCALSQYGNLSPIHQFGENTYPPSKSRTQSEHHQSTVSPQEAQSYTRMKIPDLEVIDQYGKRMRFYTDLVKGKVVVINFIYTTCTYVCPLQGASFSRLQSALGDRIGKDVYLISVSTDPLTDSARKGEHSAIAIVGSDDRGRWVRTYGLESPQRMIEIIDSIVNRPAPED